MRPLSLVLLAVGLVSPTLAVTVYLYPPPSTAVPAQLDTRHASLALAHHLGLEKFEQIGTGDGVWEGGALTAEQEGVVGTAPKNGLLVTLSEADAKGELAICFNVFSLLTLIELVVLASVLSPTFSLPSPPMDSLYPLIQTYIHRASELYTNLFTEFSPVSTSSRLPLLDIFSAPTQANRKFITSVASLVDYLDAKSTSDSGYENFAAFELNGLSDLAAQYGEDSESYQTAVKTLQAVFTSAMAHPDLKFAALTFVPATAAWKRADDDEPQTPMNPPAAPPAAPISAISGCFTSTDACANATDSCSGHGECVAATKLGRTCYVCACGVTVDDKGRKEDWAGQACERKDVSG